MDIQTFIQNFREAFGESAELPLVFWYSDQPEGETEKINGCFFKGMKAVRDGAIISLNADNIGCGGGKFYTGFTEMPERVPTFVSLKERYKQTPEMVKDFVEQVGVPRAEKKYLHFARIDKVESLEEMEGVMFIANPDMLSGLTTWAYFDNNAEDAVTSPFGSGCSSVVTQVTLENRKVAEEHLSVSSILRFAPTSKRTNLAIPFRCRDSEKCIRLCAKAVCSILMRGERYGKG